MIRRCPGQGRGEGLRFGVRGTGSEFQGSGFRVWDLGLWFGNHGSGCMSRFKVYGVGIQVQGLGFDEWIGHRRECMIPGVCSGLGLIV